MLFATFALPMNVARNSYRVDGKRVDSLSKGVNADLPEFLYQVQ
jgi:hypothetical protein